MKLTLTMDERVDVAVALAIAESSIGSVLMDERARTPDSPLIAVFKDSLAKVHKGMAAFDAVPFRNADGEAAQRRERSAAA